jgi:hypothetical protein
MNVLGLDRRKADNFGLSARRYQILRFLYFSRIYLKEPRLTLRVHTFMRVLGLKTSAPPVQDGSLSWLPSAR